MKNQLMALGDKLWLHWRTLIESINDPPKNLSQGKHTRHLRSANFLVHLLSGLIAYCHQPKNRHSSCKTAFLRPCLIHNSR